MASCSAREYSSSRHAGRALAAEREVDHPRAGVDGPLDAAGLLARVDRAVGADDAHVDDPHRLVEAGDADAVVGAAPR